MISKNRFEFPVKRNSIEDWSWSSDGIPCTAYEKDLAEYGQSAATLDSDVEADVVIVGGGYLGLGTAITLAEAGMDVIVLERDIVGDGASGRNGGHLTPGLARWEAENMLKVFGEVQARQLWRGVSTDSFALLDSLIERYQIPAQRHHGHMVLAAHPAHLDILRSSIDVMSQLGYNPLSVIEKDDLGQYISSPSYYGAMLDMSGGHLNPLAYVRGLADAARKLGVRIWEHTAVTKVDESTRTVHTKGATASAQRAVVLATHASMRDLSEAAGSKTINLISYIVGTPPLTPEMSNALMPQRYAAFDTQTMLDYYRISDDGRLIFGGLGEASQLPVDEVISILRQRIEIVFPQLLGISIEHAWGGTIDVTYNGALHVSQSDNGLFLAHGWSGHGVAQSTWIGSTIANAILGNENDFNMLSSIKHHSIPFGEQLTPFVVPAFMKLLKLQGKIQPNKIVSF